MNTNILWPQVGESERTFVMAVSAVVTVEPSPAFSAVLNLSVTMRRTRFLLNLWAIKL